jgi:hypothetical protein
MLVSKQRHATTTARVLGEGPVIILFALSSSLEVLIYASVMKFNLLGLPRVAEMQEIVRC